MRPAGDTSWQHDPAPKLASHRWRSVAERCPTLCDPWTPASQLAAPSSEEDRDRQVDWQLPNIVLSAVLEVSK